VPLELLGESHTSAQAICLEVGRHLAASVGVNASRASWPAPVAHELDSLIEVLQGRKLDAGIYVSSEAAMLQLSDLSEVLMRLLVVAPCMAVIELGGVPAQRCRHQLLHVSGGGSASVGEWSTIFSMRAWNTPWRHWRSCACLAPRPIKACNA